MDRVTLKTRAKEVMARDRVICALVAFIMGLVGSGTQMPSFRFNVQKVNKTDLEEETVDEVLASIKKELEIE